MTNKYSSFIIRVLLNIILVMIFKLLLKKEIDVVSITIGSIIVVSFIELCKWIYRKLFK